MLVFIVNKKGVMLSILVSSYHCNNEYQILMIHHNICFYSIASHACHDKNHIDPDYMLIKDEELRYNASSHLQRYYNANCKCYHNQSSCKQIQLNLYNHVV